MCGDPNVGKSSLLSVYVDGKFIEEYIQTLGANFLIKEVDLSKVIDKLNIDNPKKKKDIKEKGFRLYFWDLGGQHDKLFSNEYYFVQAVGAFIIYDILNRESFNNINFWYQKIKELSGDIPLILIGNKIDMIQKRIVSFEEAEKKAKNFGIKYFETSAKFNENVDKAFESLSIQILNNLK